MLSSLSRASARLPALRSVSAGVPSIQMMFKHTGSVKWFNVTKGYGFITPENGSDDVFVHQSQIHSEGFRSLKDAEPVEYETEQQADGRISAIDVTGPNGSFVQGAERPQQMDDYGGGGGGFGGGRGGGGGGGRRRDDDY